MVHASRAVQFSNMRYNTKHTHFWSVLRTRQRALHYGGARRVLARPPQRKLVEVKAPAVHRLGSWTKELGNVSASNRCSRRWPQST